MSGTAKIRLSTGETHAVSVADAHRLEQSMLGIGPIALSVDVDGRSILLSTAHVVAVEILADA
jgi:acid phosphatase class B